MKIQESLSDFTNQIYEQTETFDFPKANLAPVNKIMNKLIKSRLPPKFLQIGANLHVRGYSEDSLVFLYSHLERHKAKRENK